MTKIKFLFAIPLSALFVLTGCKTVPNPITIGAIQSAANIGASIALNDNPALRPQFQAAHDQLGTFLKDGKLTSAQLTTILNLLPIKELKSDTARIIITTTLVLFDSYIQQATDITKVASIQIVGSALYNGLDTALNATPEQLREIKVNRR